MRPHRFKDALVRLVCDTVSQREIAAVVLAGAESDVAQTSCPREELSILVERARHDSIRRVEGFLDSVSVMHVDVNVKDPRMITQELEDSENDIVNVAEPGCLAFLGVM